jgi:hypothetical protein
VTLNKEELAEILDGGKTLDPRSNLTGPNAGSSRGAMIDLKTSLYGLLVGLVDCKHDSTRRAKAAISNFRHYLWLDSDLLVRSDIQHLYRECLEIGNPIITANYQAIGRPAGRAQRRRRKLRHWKHWVGTNLAGDPE